jgi:hypothetical protein
MQHAAIENIYREIVLLSETERNILYQRIQKDFYEDREIVAYTTNGEPLTLEKYRKRVEAGIEQCVKGEKIDLEKLSEKLGYNYANL